MICFCVGSAYVQSASPTSKADLETDCDWSAKDGPEPEEGTHSTTCTRRYRGPCRGTCCPWSTCSRPGARSQLAAPGRGWRVSWSPGSEHARGAAADPIIASLSGASACLDPFEQRGLQSLPSRPSNSHCLHTSSPCSQNRQSLISTEGGVSAGVTDDVGNGGWVSRPAGYSRSGAVVRGRDEGGGEDVLDLSVAMVLHDQLVFTTGE